MNLVKVRETSLSTNTVIVGILRARSERLDVRFEGVQFGWNYLIITSGKANNSKVGVRTLIDMYIFSKYYIFS